MTSNAHAQAGYFYLDRAQISGAPDDGFMVWRTCLFRKEDSLLRQRHPGLFAQSIAKRHGHCRPGCEGADRQPGPGPVHDLPVLKGTEVANRASFKLMMPITVLQLTGDDPSGYDIGSGGIGDAKAMLTTFASTRACARTSRTIIRCASVVVVRSGSPPAIPTLSAAMTRPRATCSVWQIQFR